MLMRRDDGIEIECDGDVYAPAEDSLLLLSAVEVTHGDRVLEIGCGSGITALHCAKAGAEVVAVDIVPEAVECARMNAQRNHLILDIFQSDLLSDVDGEFDTILFNPPYLPSDEILDPRWSGGQSGIETTVEFLRQARTHLKNGGQILTVCSSLSDYRSLQEESASLGYDCRRISSSRFFFEEIFVLRLTITRL